jgi:diaminopropionate ammonia-lyase
VVLVEGTYEDAVRTCAQRSAGEGWQVVADVGYDGYMEIPRWITQGYGTMLEEIVEQRTAANAPAPDVVLAQAGVGGFAAAVVDHFLEREAQPRIVIVEPVEADPVLESALTPDGSPAQSTGSQRTMMGGLNCSTVSYSAWPVLRNGADMFLTIQDQWALTAMRRYAKPIGGDPPVVAGESGGAGLAALLALMSYEPFRSARSQLGLGPDSTVLLFITEGDTDADAWRRIVTEGET